MTTEPKELSVVVAEGWCAGCGAHSAHVDSAECINYLRDLLHTSELAASTWKWSSRENRLESDRRGHEIAKLGRRIKRQKEANRIMRGQLKAAITGLQEIKDMNAYNATWCDVSAVAIKALTQSNPKHATNTTKEPK